MANFNIYFPKLVKAEGDKYEDVAGDRGGPTKYGVILKEWIAQGYDKDHDGDIDKYDLKLITADDAAKIAKTHYWDKIKGDQINSQVIAEFIADFAYTSGTGTSAKKAQEVLSVEQDGVIGPDTVAKINAEDPKVLLSKLKARREKFYRAIVVNDASQNKFLNGWLNRNNSFNV